MKSTRPFYLDLGHSFMSDYLEFKKHHPLNDEHRTSFVSILRNKEFPISKLKFDRDKVATSRIIGTWIEHGLIDRDTRDTKGSWIKFSYMDLFWIRIIVKLRRFGFPIEQIENVKFHLFEQPHYPEGQYLFDFFVVHVTQNHPVGIIVFEDGTASIGLETQIQDNLPLSDVKDFIHIDLNPIVQEFFINEDFTPDYKMISNAELEILELVRSKKFSKVEVILKDGTVESYKTTMSEDASRRLGDIINEPGSGYQEIHLTEFNGRIVSINRTVTKKVK